MKLAAGTAQTALESTSPKGVAFVQLDFDSGTQRLTTASDTLSWNGQTWAGLGGLLSVEPLRENDATEIAGGRLLVSGVPSSEISKALTENIQGRTITLWFGVMNDSYAVIDAPVEFIGRMNRYRFLRGNPTSTLELTFESEMAVARRPRVRRFTDQDQRLVNANDTYFEHLSKTKEMLIRFPTAEAQRR